MTEPSEPTTAELAETLAELRTLLEQANAHTKAAADRYNDLRMEMETVKRVNLDTARELHMLRQRVDEIRPPSLNCPHCGRKVQKDWTHCRICTKPL